MKRRQRPAAARVASVPDTVAAVQSKRDTVSLRDPARRPHRETRRLVDRDGQDAPRLLYAAFDAFNSAFFGSRLAAPMIWISPASSPRAESDYTARDEHGLQSRIRIAPSLWRNRSVRYILGILLHEMVHAACHELRGEVEPGYNGHGPVFAAECNRLGELLGFPRVSPKGRRGFLAPEHWPHLPAGDDDPPVSPERAKKWNRAPEAPEGSEHGGDGDLGDRLKGLVAAAVAVERRAVLHWLHEAGRVLALSTASRKSGVRILTLADEIEADAHIGPAD